MSSEFKGSDWIWKEGDFVPWADVHVHLLSTAVQFGLSVFEGIRAYDTPKGSCVFRLREHITRLVHSAKIYRMVPEYTEEEWIQACRATVAKNGLGDCYIRPMILRGYGAPGLDAAGSPIESYIAAWPWGTYLGEGALERGVDVCVSSWNRPAPNTFPVQAKAAGHYNNAVLIKAEALANGYSEAIVLGPDGTVSEGSGQNLFMIRDGVLLTSHLDGTSLRGITRDALITLAKEAGLSVREQPIPREDLYTADEVFFTGTASEVTPIRSVDRIEVGSGKAGPITLQLQERFLGIAKGEEEDLYGWLTPVG
jgi:branched-chain amino acid aminotransferase